MKDNNRKIKGAFYEDLACAFLKKKGYRLIERNFSCRTGEIDIIAEDGGTLVFIEVRYREYPDFGGALLSITPSKLKRIKKAADYYLFTKCPGSSPGGRDFRFDALVFEGGEPELYKNIDMPEAKF